jgi:hypothetical protein
MSTLSAIIRSKIKAMLEDGLSNREIASSINKLRRENAESTLTVARISKIVNELMEEEEAEQEQEAVSVYSDSSSEVSDDSKDLDYEPDDEEESDDGSSCSSGSSETTVDYDTTIPEKLLCKSAHLSLYHKEAVVTHYDLIKVTPVYNDLFEVHCFYDRRDNSDYSCLQSKWYGTAEEVKEYVTLMMKMIAYDQKPFGEFEVCIPYFPSVSFVPKTMRSKSKRNLITTALDQFMYDANNKQL